MTETRTDEMLPEFVSFFENAARGRLAFPFCRGCGRFHWYPMPRCPHCRGKDVEWRQVEGRGRLASFTSVLHPFDKSRAHNLPYVVALVQFADAPGITLVTNIVGGDIGPLSIGQSVEAVFRTNAAGTSVVEFRVA